MLSQYIDKLNSSDVLSLDIFDTAIVRLFYHPHDVFYFMEKHHSIDNFAERRYKSSLVAKSRKKLMGAEDVTIQDIYDLMVESGVLSQEQSAEIMRSEQDIELLCSACNPHVYLLYERALALGKKIIFTSDMYLDIETVQKILHKAGYTNYDKIFLSSEIGKTKHSGNLYYHLLNNLGVEPGKVLHIGDNYQSDVLSGSECGINAMRYIPVAEQPLHSNQIQRWYRTLIGIHAHSVFASLMLGTMLLMTLCSKVDRNDKSYWYWNGAQLTAPLLINFCIWLEKQLIKEGISNIFFQARDGLIIKKVFDKLATNTFFKTTYMFSSRKFWQNVLDRNNENLVLKYLDDIGFTKVHSAIVDVGRKGTLQSRICDFLNKHSGTSVTGFYIDFRGNDYPGLDIRAFFKDAHEDMKPFLDLLDFLLMADHPLIVGLKTVGSSYQPEFLEPEAEHYNLQRVAADMHVAIDRCVGLLAPLLRRFSVPHEQDFVCHLAKSFSMMTAEEERKLSSITVRLGDVDQLKVPLNTFFGVRRLPLAPAKPLAERLGEMPASSQTDTPSWLYKKTYKGFISALRSDWDIFKYVENFPLVVFLGEFQGDFCQMITSAHPKTTFFNIEDSLSAKPPANDATRLPVEALAMMPPEHTLFLISDKNSLLLASKLARSGFTNIFDVSFSSIELYSKHFSSELIKGNLEKILSAAKMFNDQLSQELYWGKLLYRITHNPLYISSADYPEYFHPSCRPEQGDCIIDAGAFDGDTLKIFWDSLNGHCTIISFEPDPQNFKNLSNRISEIPKFKGKAFNMGLWEEEKDVSFIANGNVNASVEGVRLPCLGNTTVKVTSIDSICRKTFIKPSFIKLDVEGAEQAVIRGGESIMRHLKPKMAICAYHNYDDLWELPIMIKENNPDYQLALGHQSDQFPHWDTVLYAF